MEDLEEIKLHFEWFDNWEEKYKFIIDIGKNLPVLPDAERIDKNLVHGCQSQVWIVADYEHVSDHIEFKLDSDAHIVRGLIAIVQAAYGVSTPLEVVEYDIEGLFAELELMSHLTATRGNGLRAMIHRIRSEAQEYLEN